MAARPDLAAQCRALRDGCGLWLNPARAHLIVKGEDRQRLLNGLVTCEIADLAPGSGVRGFFTDVKGHILSDVVIRAAEKHLRLELPGTEVTSIAVHIEKYIVVDRVEVRVAEEAKALSLVGPRSARVVGSILDGLPVSTLPWSHGATTLLREEVLISADSDFGSPALTLWASPAAIAEIQRQLLAVQPSTELVEVSAEAIEILQVEKGIPRFGIDYGRENLPQETGLDDAVSYSKGCYLGQEVVARLHYRGQVARSLCRLRSPAGEPPRVGTRLLLEDREAGTVTSAVRSPIGEETFLLAMLQRRAMDRGTQLRLESGVPVRVI